MPIYRLEPRPGEERRWPGRGSVLAAIVVADTSDRAREFAARACKDEGPDVWLNLKYSTCTPVDLGREGVVLAHGNGF